MKVEYERKSSSIVNYVVELPGQEIIDLPEHPLQIILPPTCLGKKFLLRVGATDDDSDLEMHCHPSLTCWEGIKEIHTTVSPVAYDILDKNGKYESNHDHGHVTIIKT